VSAKTQPWASASQTIWSFATVFQSVDAMGAGNRCNAADIANSRAKKKLMKRALH
jgi:hypothetical protein